MMTRRDHIAIAKGIQATGTLTMQEKRDLAASIADYIEPLSKNFDFDMFYSYATAYLPTGE